MKLSNNDKNRWQLEAARALVEMLRAALKDGMPTVRWSTDGLQLVGRIVRFDFERDGDEYHEGDGLDARDVFNRWCDYVHATQRTETPVGTTYHLRGEGKAPNNDRIKVVILADIYQDPEDEQPAPPATNAEGK